MMLLRVAAHRDEKNIAFAGAYALHPFRSIELIRRHGVVERNERLATQTRNVEQYAASDDAILRRHDAVAARAGRAHIGRRKSVVHLAFNEDVTQRVDVAGCQAMIGDADEIERYF